MTRRARMVVLAVTIAVATWAGSAEASTTPKHAPRRPLCARRTKKQAVAAIKKTWDTLLNGTLTLTAEQRFAVVDGSDIPSFRATLDDLTTENAAMMKAATERVARVTCTSTTTADVDYRLHVEGTTDLDLSGSAVLVGRQWKASKVTVCDLFAPGDPSLAQFGPCAL